MKSYTQQLDDLAIEYNKYKDPEIKAKWFSLVRRAQEFLPSHTQTSDTILAFRQHWRQKPYRQIK